MYNDYSTTSVIEWLNFYSKKWIRLNATDEISLDFNYNDILFKTRDVQFNLSEITSCWYRTGFLNFNFNISTTINEFRTFNKTETENVAEYIHYRLSLIKHINNFSKSVVNKLVVSDIARRLALKTPTDYLINTKTEIEKLFLNSDTHFITKSISGNPLHQFTNFTLFNYTHKINLDEIVNEDFAVSLVQTHIEKKYEIRVFYFNKSFYTMAIFSQSDKRTSIDFRNYNKSKPNRIAPYKLPDIIKHKLILLMRVLNLNCGSIDMIVNNQNEHIFLEVNPIGQFGMVSKPCNFNLEKLIAEYL